MSDYTFEAIAHAFTFGLLTVLTWRAIMAGTSWLGTRIQRHAIVLSGLGAALYGLSDELHQRFVPGRWSTFIDWLADLAGVVLAMGVLWVWMRSKPRLVNWCRGLRSGHRPDV